MQVLRVHSHLWFIRPKVLRELFSPHIHLNNYITRTRMHSSRMHTARLCIVPGGREGGVVTWSWGGGRCCHLVPGGGGREVLSPGPEGGGRCCHLVLGGGRCCHLVWGEGGRCCHLVSGGGREVLSRDLWSCTPSSPPPPPLNRMSDTCL